MADRARLRQLINQSVDQLTVAVGDIGYRHEIDLYAGKLSGGDLVEAALTHNLEAELTEIVNMANRTIRPLIEIYTSRFEYQNAGGVPSHSQRGVGGRGWQQHSSGNQRRQHPLAQGG